MCVNSRTNNTITTKYNFPMPMLEDMLNYLRGVVIFTKLDLKSGFYRI